MRKCPVKTKYIVIKEINPGYDMNEFGDTTPPDYIYKKIMWPKDDHYWEIRGFFGKYKQCQKCQVCET